MAKWGRYAGPQICMFSFLQRQTDVMSAYFGHSPIIQFSLKIILSGISEFASYRISVSTAPV